MSDIEIIPTCVPHDRDGLRVATENIRPFSRAIHIDINDGLFTKNFSWPYREPGAFEPFDLSGAEGMFMEVHLMTRDPREIGEVFARTGASRIIAHVEAFADAENARETLQAFRAHGASKVGLSALIETPIEALLPLATDCDVIQLMSIAEIGAQGAPFNENALSRVAEMHARFPYVLLSVDGGVDESNIADLARAGARRFSVGSAISTAEDPKTAYERLQTLAESAIQ